MIYAAIIEDEKVYAEYMKLLLVQWAEAKVEIQVSIFLNGVDIFECENEFDIVFIDLNLGQEDGMETAKKLRSTGYRNTIVFITNYQSRAIEGYTVNAYRYFLKPIQPRDIKDCMDFVLNNLAGTYYQYTYHGITSRIVYENIICFESMQHYIDIFISNKKTPLHIKGVLKEIQEKCPAYFIRCQRSYIVNSYHIAERRGNKLILSNDKVVDIAPRYSKAVSSIMNEGESSSNGKNGK